MQIIPHSVPVEQFFSELLGFPVTIRKVDASGKIVPPAMSVPIPEPAF